MDSHRPFLFRGFLRALHQAETPEDYARAGYWFLLPFTAVVGAFVAFLLPSPSFLQPTVLFFADRFHIPPALVASIPTGLACAALIWLGGYCAGPVKNFVGVRFATLLLRSADYFAAVGEHLAANRTLSAFIVLLFAAGGLSSWVQYHKLQTIADEQDREFRIWLAALSGVVEHATHSVRDIPAYRRVAEEHQEIRAPLEAHPIANASKQWLPLTCLDQLIGDTFAPLDSNPPEVADGVRWRQRLRRALASHAQSPCSALSTTTNYLPDSVEGEAASLYNLLLGRSHLRLAGDNCTDQAYIVKAFGAFSSASDSLHHTHRESGLGNVFSCVARIYSRSRDLANRSEDLEKICSSTEDCYYLALESHNRSALDYEPCSFLALRSLNNRADLAIKLAIGKWRAVDAPADFIDSDSLIRSLEQLLADMIGCLGRDRTPAEVSVTIAQVYGTLAEGFSERSPEARAVALSRAGSYLASSVLHAPGELETWDLSYFCTALNSGSRGLDETFQRSFQLAGVAESTVGTLLGRIEEACRSANSGTP